MSRLNVPSVPALWGALCYSFEKCLRTAHSAKKRSEMGQLSVVTAARCFYPGLWRVPKLRGPAPKAGGGGERTNLKSPPPNNYYSLFFFLKKKKKRNESRMKNRRHHN